MRKRIKYIVFVILIAVLIVRCHAPKQYRFSQEFDQIEEIRIVEGMTEKDAGLGNFTNIIVLASVPEEAWNQFMEDFREIECRSYVGDPSYCFEGQIIQIIYKDGGIELISKYAGFYHRFDEDGIGKFKSRFFNKEQFKQLIEYYLQEFRTGE